MKSTLCTALLLSFVTAPASAQTPNSIADKTRGLQRIDGFVPLYWDAATGKLWMEISRFEQDFLYITGAPTGLGNNDLGLDRGQIGGERVVRFERVGNKVLMVEPNQRFRTSSTEPAARRGVLESFPTSTLWGFRVEGETNGTVLVDATDFALRDVHGVVGALARSRQGTYRMEPSRSALYLANTRGFPRNTEIEVSLTFTSDQPGNLVRTVAPSPEAITMRERISLVALPDSGYTPRAFDPRAGFFQMAYRDLHAALGEDQNKQFIARHRLQKKDPRAAVSEAVKPIIYYLDRGAPEPIRAALLQGARWWNQAFEAAGYRNAFQVELLPEGADPMDIRYNMIQWVQRYNRGWSYGNTVSDPRTGEIIKGHVTLGALRVRQDYLLAEGLLSPYRTGTERATAAEAMALARLRQLSAHEVGHTLGLQHNYISSVANRASVMDYPHPVARLNSDGSIDLADAYAAVELARMMRVRQAALTRFGEQSIQQGRPFATLEEVLVPLYLHHRYQVEAAIKTIGGQYYTYAMRGDGQQPTRPVPPLDQRNALSAVLQTITPEALAFPRPILALIPPRPGGYPESVELFDKVTDPVFDAITPAATAADMVLQVLFNSERAARLVQQHSLDPGQPGLVEVIDSVLVATARSPGEDPYFTALARAVQRVVVDRMIGLAAQTRSPEVKAIATLKLRQIADDLSNLPGLRSSEIRGEAEGAAHLMQLAADIKRYLDRPWDPTSLPRSLTIPPGSPIGVDP